MPKKSHRVASRQAAVRRERKRRKRSRAQPWQRQAVATPAKPATEARVAEPPTAPEPSAVTKPPPSARPAVRPVAPRYQYVIPELRKIAIIAGAMLAILIALTFLLG